MDYGDDDKVAVTITQGDKRYSRVLIDLPLDHPDLEDTIAKAIPKQLDGLRVLAGVKEQ